MKNNKRSLNVSMIGMFLALALIFSYIETLIPIQFAIPGMKLGLANVVTIIVLFTIGEKEAFFISVLRAILTGFLFGNLFSISYSLAGGLLSLVSMILLKKHTKLNIISISITGGIFHNVGQLIMACIILNNINILYYIMILFFSGIVTGLLIGIISQEIIFRIKHLF